MVWSRINDSMTFSNVGSNLENSLLIPIPSTVQTSLPFTMSTSILSSSNELPSE